MKSIFLLMIALLCNYTFSQCNVKTTNRPDGATIRYFTPKPVAKASTHEAGMSLYYNEQSKQYTLTIFLLFKQGMPQELTGELMIQTTNSNGLSLKPYLHKLVEMNGNNVAMSIYYLTQSDVNELKKYPIKTLAVNVDRNIIGLTATENKTVIIEEYKCLNL